MTRSLTLGAPLKTLRTELTILLSYLTGTETRTYGYVQDQLSMKTQDGQAENGTLSAITDLTDHSLSFSQNSKTKELFTALSTWQTTTRSTAMNSNFLFRKTGVRIGLLISRQSPMFRSSTFLMKQIRVKKVPTRTSSSKCPLRSSLVWLLHFVSLRCAKLPMTILSRIVSRELE